MHTHEKRQLGLVGALAVVLLGGGWLLVGGGKDNAGAIGAAASQTSAPAAVNTPTATDPASPQSSTPADGAEDASIVDDDPSADSATPGTGLPLGAPEPEGCVLTVRSVAVGSDGSNVKCLQKALTDVGYYSGEISGVFDGATEAAVRKLQTDKDMYVDGIAGRETGLYLKIWPDEASLVVHTPKPAPGAKDLAGFKLSSVASAGDNAPPLPENSGSGRRLVYSRAGQRVWAVDKNGKIVRSWLVSGSKYNNELPGTHKVYSKSAVTTAWNGKAFLNKMVRWLKTERGAIGFHQIPVHRSDGTVYQTEDELGSRLSGGCQRQAPLDAAFTWAWATIGTPVVVV